LKKNTRLLGALLSGLVISASFSPLAAAVFNRAEVSRVHNQVTLIEDAGKRRPAEIRDVVAGDTAVQTGLQSRAELRFPDSTLTRLASNTLFSFRSGTRAMDLNSGAILFQVPPGSGGAEIHAAAITAAITGTTGFVERVGNVYKLIVLEGDVRVYLRKQVGESFMVRGGQMLIAPANSTSVRGWQVVDVDVEKLVNSSTLMDSQYFGPLPNQARSDINRVALDQQGRINRGRLSRTNLVIDGGVTQITMVDRDTRRRSDTRPVPPPPTPIATGPRPPAPPDPINADPNPQPLPTPNPNPTPGPNPPPTATPPGITRPNPYVISPATAIATSRGGTPNITTDNVTNTGRIYRGNALDGSASRFVFGSTRTFDLRSNFDERFGRNSEGQFAPAGVAVFRFGSLRIVGAPAIDTTGGPIDLALVAANLSSTNPGIVSGGPGGTWDLSGLRSLFLGTDGSSIVLDNPLGFSASGATFRYLHLYARGADSDTTFGSVAFLVGDLLVDSERDTILNVRADVVVRRLLLTAGRNLSVAGRTSAAFTQLSAGSGLDIAGDVTSTRFFGFADDARVNGSLTADYVNFQITGDFLNGVAGSRISTAEFILTADTFQLNGVNGAGTTFDLTRLTRLELNVGRLTLGSDFTLPAGTAALLNLGNIDAPDHGLFNFDSIVTSGPGDDRLSDLSTRSFTAANSLLIGRDLRADTLAIGDVLAIGGDYRPFSAATNFIRTVSADTIAIGGGINFAGANGSGSTGPGDGFSLQLLASSIVINDGSGFGIDGVNLDGGDATSSGVGGSGGTLQIGNDTTPIAGDVVLSGPISATTGRNFNASPGMFGGNGGSVNVVANGTITASSRIETSANSNIRRSARGGNVRLTSNRTSGTAIRVASTAQIASLLAAGAPGPGGEVVFRSAGGDVDISGSVTADRGRGRDRERRREWPNHADECDHQRGCRPRPRVWHQRRADCGRRHHLRRLHLAALCRWQQWHGALRQ
jgi:hypothetical protein